MKLCPNCNLVFDVKAGKLHCPEHGWHALNESGEVIPADPPTAAELAEHEKAIEDEKRSKAFADHCQGMNEPEIEETHEDKPESIETGNDAIALMKSGSLNSSKSGLIILAIAAIVAVGVFVVEFKRYKKQRSANES